MKQKREVSEQSGFRWLIVAILAALLIGTLVRVSLSPAKIEKILRAKIDESPIRDNLVFASAGISLADGPLPDLALILNKVEWRNGNQCAENAPIRAKVVRVPLRLLSLLSGNVSAGSVKIEELSVDLDDIKRDCNAAKKSDAHSEVLANAPPAAAVLPREKSTPGEVWKAEDQTKIAAMVSGIRITRAEVFFENRMKSVVVEDLVALWRGDALDVSTSIRFPPATVFGENLPNFTINGTVKQHEMMADIHADLSEGSLEANALLKPIVFSNGAKELEADLKLSVADLPLSVVTPLLSKSGIVTGAFQPKFMWLDCGADIHGVFSRLLVDNPVSLAKCAVSGQVGRASFDKAIRLPSGQWQPFEVKAEKLDIARVFETFAIQGPSGVFSNFGQLNGKIAVNSPESASANASLSGAVIRFAGAEGAALQPFAIGKIDAKLSKTRWNLSLDEFKPEGGTADFSIVAEADRDGRSAKIDVALKHLKLNSRVEKAIFTGDVADISGAASIAMDFSKETGKTNLTKLKSALTLNRMHGTEVAAEEIKVEANLGRKEVELTAKAPTVEVLKTGNLFRLLQPALLGWSGEVSEQGQHLILNRVAIKGRFLDNSFQWNQATASVGKLLNLTSHGSVFRDHAIDSNLEAHFPLASRLKWNISGTWMQPKFAGASNELGALFAKAGLPKESVTGVVPARLLGLPKDAEHAVPEISEPPVREIK